MWEYITFGLIVQLFVNGILFGTMYGIAAIGLSLIFGTMRIIFLAQGTMIIFMAYVCYWIFTLMGIDPYLSLILIVPLSLVIGMGLYHALFREAAGLEDKNISLLIAVGLMFLVENLIMVLWTANPRSITTSYTLLSFKPMGINISFTRLMGLSIAVISTTGVLLFLKKTLIGMAVRAASEDIISATLMGISPHRVNAVAFAIGIGLAGVAGVGLATIYPFDPYYGFIFALKAMISLAIGGIGSVFGALFGGILLGLLESLASFFFTGGWSDAIAYAAFLIVLMFKPEGLFVRSVKKA
ncbi:MAG: branched-chain amino acid ABC transporter permease [Deltaproteobacteria bacterium]|nr:branched-chain amino acid ABC transporter permease [Deltaproteobacteria bacterium]